MDGLGAEAGQARRVQPLRADRRARAAFSAVVGDAELLRRVRYVITLDADTVLPPDAAPLLVGALAHPLNRAVYDAELGRVVRGYGILQPRVGRLAAERAPIAASPRSTRATPAWIPTPPPSPTSTRTSTARGASPARAIYDVEAFERATHGRFPENTLLSHDLIEGNYARAGLATDVIVYDDYPTRYLTYTRRKHRWIRGDWQLLPWLTALGAGSTGAASATGCRSSRGGRSSTTCGAARWSWPSWSSWWPGGRSCPARRSAGRCSGSGAIAAPWIVALLLALVRPPLDKSWRAYYAAVAHDVVTSMQQIALAVAFLPHQAWVSADAIVRTLWRMMVSHRHLLEWQTASQIERGTGHHDRSGVAPDVAGGRPGDAHHRVGGLAPVRADATRLGIRGGRAPAGTRLDRLAPDREGPCGAGAAQRAAPGGRGPATDAPLCPAPLAFLRPVRQRAHQLARTGQFPGGSQAGSGDADLSHQHRSPAAGYGQRARPRLHHS